MTRVGQDASDVSSPPGGLTLSTHLEATVARCAGVVYGAASRHGLIGSDVDEVFQEVRIRLWRSLKSSEKIDAVPASYVYRTAASAALDIIRRRRARPESDLHPEHENVSVSSDPEKDLERSEIVELVKAAVGQLIASRRPVVRMHLNGYKLEEIAHVLGWTEPKTRNLLYRGMEDLRKTLSSLGENPQEVP